MKLRLDHKFAAGTLIGGVTGLAWLNFICPPLAVFPALVGGCVGGLDDGVKVTDAIRVFDASGSEILTMQERQNALFDWKHAYKRTEELWSEMGYESQFGQYRIKLGVPPEPVPWHSAEQSRGEELARAATAHRSFTQRILRLGTRVINPDWLAAAAARYVKFLQLKRNNPDAFLVPTLDVDLIWHCHQLTPQDYYEDCHALFGRVLRHNTEAGDSTIADQFQETQRLWRNEFGEDFVPGRPAQRPAQRSNGKQDRGAPGGSGCMSCGWGHSTEHDALGHKEVERQMVEKAQSVDGAGGHEDGAEWGEGESIKQTLRHPLHGSSHDGEDGDGGSDCGSCASCGGD